VLQLGRSSGNLSLSLSRDVSLFSAACNRCCPRNQVVGQDSNEIFFKIKKQTRLQRLMEAYCDRVGKTLSSVRFLYDGERVNAQQTAEDLDLNDGDQIEAMVEQIGG